MSKKECVQAIQLLLEHFVLLSVAIGSKNIDFIQFIDGYRK